MCIFYNMTEDGPSIPEFSPIWKERPLSLYKAVRQRRFDLIGKTEIQRFSIGMYGVGEDIDL